MNCADCKEFLVAYVEGLLSEEQKRSITSHLKDCPGCRAELKELTDLHDRLVRNGEALAQRDLETDVMNQIARVARVQNARLKAAKKAGKGLAVRRNIMRSPIMKFAAAASIIVAVLVGLHVFGSGSIALAEVLEKIEKIKAFTYKMKMDMSNMPGMPEGKVLKMEMEATVAKDVGMRMTSHAEGKLASEAYIMLDEKVIVTIMPEQKQYMRMTLTGEMLEKMQKENGDPRAFLEDFRNNEYIELGRSVVDGVEVEGFESTDPNIAQNALGNILARLWVDVETKLPIRYDITMLSDDGEPVMDMNVCEFQWDIEVEPDFFVVNIPEDYKLMADIELAGGEESLVEGLGFFAEMTGGRYPSELSPIKMAQELQEIMMTNIGSSPKKTDQEEAMQKMMNLQMASAFYIGLGSGGKDPAYYGSKVTAEFPDAVLVRWKLEDGTYRVIFGNLSIGQATVEELADLEAAPLNSRPTAIKPDPANGTEGTALTGLKLRWMGGAYVTDHKVYFGTAAEELALLGEVITEYAEPGELQRGTTYFWRIDEVQPDGSLATGDVWSFNTGGLVAHWKLDAGSGEVVADSSGNGFDGKFVEEPVWTAGKIGGALEFDSNDYVEITDSNDLAIVNQITVSAWIKVDAFNKGWQAIVCKGDRSWRLQRQGRKNKNALEFACTGVLIPGTVWGSVYGSVDVNDGQWHHAAGVYDGEQVLLYVDGKLDTSKKASGKIGIGDGAIFIGANSQRVGRSWNGLIDDVRIYSYGMTADEVAALAKQ